MRKLMALAIVLVVTGISQSYALIGLGELSYDGSLEFAGFSAKNEADRNDSGAGDDRRGEVNTRQRVGINGDVTENVGFRVEFGRNGGFGESVTGTNAASSSVHDEISEITLENLYVQIANFYGGISARLGRQYIGNAGDLIWNFAPTDDNNMTFNAIDGLLLQHRASFVHTDLFVGKMRENEDSVSVSSITSTNLNDGASDDVNLNSLDFVFPTIVPNAKVNLGYVWGTAEKSSATSDDNSLKTYRVGINGGLMDNKLTYRAEYFMNDGENEIAGFNGGGKTDYEGSAIDLGLGYNLADGPGGSWGFNANIIMASGDDNDADTKDESFRDFTALGFDSSDRLLGDIFGKSNTMGSLGQGVDTGAEGTGLEVWNLGVTFGPKRCPRSTFSFNWYQFNTSEDSQFNGTTNVDQGDEFGTEFDLNYGFRYSDNVNLGLGYAVLMPEEAIVGVTAPSTPAPEDDAIQQLSAKLTVKWGGQGGGMQQIDPAK